MGGVGRVMGKGRVIRDYYKEGYCCDGLGCGWR
jgi:hypothetical protein